MLKTSFDKIWWGGFIIVMLVVFTLIISNTSNEIYTNILPLALKYKYVFLFFGVFHMILLSLVGIQTNKNKLLDNHDIGSRIATMGYLHTLIGTSIALILISHSKSENLDMLSQIDLIIVPIGSALFTSIIGWAVAAEFERGIYGKSEKTVVDFALDDLASEIKLLAKELSTSSQAWKNSIDTTVQNIENNTNDLNLKYEKIIIDSTSTIFSQIETHVQNIESQLSLSSQSSQKTINSYLDTFNQLNENMQTQMQTIQNTFETTTSDSQDIMNSLLRSFEELFTQMNQHAKTIQKDFSSSTNAAKDTIGSLATSYDELQVHIKQNLQNIEQTLTNSSKKADNSILKFMQSFEELFIHLEKYSESLKINLTQSSEDVEKLINQLTNSFSTVFSHVDGVTTQWEDHIVNMQKFSNDSSINLQNLLADSKIVASELKEVAEGVPPASKILREIDDILLVISSINEKNI